MVWLCFLTWFCDLNVFALFAVFGFGCLCLRCFAFIVVIYGLC